MKTAFIDIDGTLLFHHGKGLNGQADEPLEVLPGVKEKLLEWEKKGYTIVLTTGRRPCMWKITEKQLEDAGIYYDRLIMGLPRGERFVVNDRKPGQADGNACSAWEVERNVGIGNVDP